MKDCKLISNYNSGEGDIQLSETFNAADPLLRADILKDWIFLLGEQYKKALVEMREG